MIELLPKHPLSRNILIGGTAIGVIYLGMYGADQISPSATYERAFATDGHCLQGTDFTLENRADEALIQPAPHTDDPQILRITPHYQHDDQPTFLEFDVERVPNTLTPELTPRGTTTLSYLAVRGCNNSEK